MNYSDQVVIVSSLRTPIGAFNSSLSKLSATQLGAIVIRGILESTDFDIKLIDNVLMGNVLSAGLGQAPARQAGIGAGLSNQTPCTTINKMCGSGMEAILMGMALIQSGQAEVLIGGGMESMSNVPYYLNKARSGFHLGHGEITDGLIKDGLWDVYNDFHMGEAAELCADKFSITREAQDAFALSSYTKAQKAIANHLFDDQIVSCDIKSSKSGKQITISEDEEPARANFEKFSQLSPVFTKNGTITAANASSLNDGASACLLMKASKANELGLPILANITGLSRAAHDPKWFSTAPIVGIKKLLSESKMTSNDIQLFEINEAFSAISLSIEKELKLNPSHVNVHGGAVALGHPIGASGARILCTLVHALKSHDKSTGIASCCIGGGEATSIMVERV